MTTVQNVFSGGTAGATITTGNSGGTSGDAFATVTGPFIYSATGARSGLGGRVQISSSTAWRSYHSWSSTTQLAARVAFTFNGSVANSVTLCGAVNSAFATAAKFGTNAAGKGVVLNAAGSTLATAATALAADTEYIVEYQVAPGSTTSNGTIAVQLYAASAPGTLLLNYSATTVNAGTLGLVRGQLGNNDLVAALDVTFDDVRYDLATLTAVGPPGANTAPISNAGPDQVGIEPWATVTLDGTGSTDPDLGDTITYAWTQTAGTTVTLSSSTASQPTFTAPATIAGTTLTFSLVVTDNNGAASTANTVNVTVLAVTERAVVGGVQVPMRLRAVSA